MPSPTAAAAPASPGAVSPPPATPSPGETSPSPRAATAAPPPRATGGWTQALGPLAAGIAAILLVGALGAQLLLPRLRQ